MYNYNTTEQKIAEELIKMGFSISNKSFNYIIDGIILIHKNDDVGAMYMYDYIAEKHNSTCARVERSMRSDIAKYYDQCKNIPSLLHCNYKTGALPSKEFIYRLSYMFRNILGSDGNKY